MRCERCGNYVEDPEAALGMVGDALEALTDLFAGQKSSDGTMPVHAAGMARIFMSLVAPVRQSLEAEAEGDTGGGDPPAVVPFPAAPVDRELKELKQDQARLVLGLARSNAERIQVLEDALARLSGEAKLGKLN